MTLPATDDAVLDPVAVTAAAPQPQPSAPAAPYAARAITLTFLLNSGSFSPTDPTQNQLTVKNLRCQVQITRAQVTPPESATILVWGLTPSQINSLTLAGLNYLVSSNFNNKVVVEAGDATSGMTKVFTGTIITAYPNFKAQPDVPFVVTATGAQDIQLKPVPALSFNGATPVATALQQMATSAGLNFENNGVNTVLASPYFPGTAYQQIKRAVAAANIFATIDSTTNTLAIWPKNGSRSTGGTPTLSPQTGMIGYPEYYQNAGVQVRTLFNPSINLSTGQKFKLVTSLPAAAGTYTVQKVDYSLSSLLPAGPWEMVVIGWPIGQQLPVGTN